MTREKLLSVAVKQLTKVNLNVLISNIDYRGSKPDLVVIYPEVDKYYITEVIAEDCFQSPYARLRSVGYDADSRDFCKKLYTGDERLAIWAAALYCDLGQGVELFGYSSLKGINFENMQKYASLIFPVSFNNEAEQVFNKFGLMYRCVDVSNIFTLALFSYSDSVKLAENRRFMQFLAANRG